MCSLSDRLAESSKQTRDYTFETTLLQVSRGKEQFLAGVNENGVPFPALVAPGSLAGVWSGTAPQALQAFNTIDVFVIQATTNTLCAHFISLLSTLSLLARSVKW